MSEADALSVIRNAQILTDWNSVRRGAYPVHAKRLRGREQDAKAAIETIAAKYGLTAGFQDNPFGLSTILVRDGADYPVSE